MINGKMRHLIESTLFAKISDMRDRSIIKDWNADFLACFGRQRGLSILVYPGLNFLRSMSGATYSTGE